MGHLSAPDRHPGLNVKSCDSTGRLPSVPAPYALVFGGTANPPQMATLSTILLFPLLVLLGVILWISESRDQRIRRWVASGVSQREAARRLGISRYAVSKALAAA